MDEMRAQLASLMESIKAQPTDFTDPEVCKYYLTGLCPHDLFENTRFSLGACKKTHSEELRARYLEARKTKRYGYEELSIQVVKSLIEEAERKVEKGNLRSDDENGAPEQLSEELMAELKELEEDIDEKLREIERLTEKGMREEAAALNEIVAALQVKRCKLMFRGGEGNSQKLRPCDVCGALLSVHDSGKRLDEHFQGRIHIGFQKLRNVLKRHLEYIASAPLPDAALRPQQKGYVFKSTLSVNAMVALNQVNSQPVQRVDLDALTFITEAQRRALPHIAAAVAPSPGIATEEGEEKALQWKEKSPDPERKRNRSQHERGGQHRSSSSSKKKKRASSSRRRSSRSRSRDRKKSGSSSSSKTHGEHRTRKERSSDSSGKHNTTESSNSSGVTSGSSSSSNASSSGIVNKQKEREDRGHSYKQREEKEEVRKDSISRHHKKSKRKK